MFNWLGRGIAYRPAWFITVWLLAVAAGAAYSLTRPEAPLGEVGSFLPEQSLHNRGVALIREAFPQLANNSYIALVSYRPGGLTPQDFVWIDRLANEAGKTTEGRVLSPAAPFLRQRLVSHDGDAAIAMINLSSNFISKPTIEAVDRVTALTHAGRPEGLAVEVTGTAGIGRDYFRATREAIHRTTVVTVLAVLLILILVYRSPVGAMIPLVSIGASAYLGFVLLSLLTHFGWQVSDMEKLFAVVLIFGAGVDYALFWIARYRESLDVEHGIADQAAEVAPRFASAAHHATVRTGPAILASAATIICGLSTMLAADLAPSRHAGRVLAVVLLVALLAALTLAPALARLLGRWLFWPMRPTARPAFGLRVIWPRLADHVTRRPWPVLLVGVAALTFPALAALRIAPRFDSLSELPPGSSSSRGFDLAREHFTKGQLYSNTILMRFPGGMPVDLPAVSREFTAAALKVPGALDVYSLSAPLGKAQPAAASGFSSLVTRTFYQSHVSGDPVLRFEILIDYLPFSPEAIASIEAVMAAARDVAANLSGYAQSPQVLIAGPTGYIIAVREVATHDQRVIMLLATAVIAVIVLIMVRNVPLMLFMVLSTWMTYGATLTLSDLFFVHVMGTGSLDWKVRLILFVIVVAVGQDYNIFLVSRLLGQDASRSAEEITRDAIVRTGSVISSCGIIMAATLGSLWAGRLILLEQLGFALALGILIDTFFVRPLLIPSFFLALARQRRSRPVFVPALNEPHPEAGGM